MQDFNGIFLKYSLNITVLCGYEDFFLRKENIVYMYTYRVQKRGEKLCLDSVRSSTVSYRHFQSRTRTHFFPRLSEVLGSNCRSLRWPLNFLTCQVFQTKILSLLFHRERFFMILFFMRNESY